VGTTSSIDLSTYQPATPTCSATGGTGGTGGSSAGASGSDTGGTAGFGGSSSAVAGTGGTGGSGGAAGSAGATAGAAAGSGGTGAGCYNYDSTAQTVTVIGREIIQFALPNGLSVGQSVVVHVTGTNQAATGFRSWLVDNMQVTSSNVVQFTGQNGSTVPPANFTLDYTLTVTTGTPWYLFFKAPSSGGIIENVTFLTITVTL